MEERKSPEQAQWSKPAKRLELTRELWCQKLLDGCYANETGRPESTARLGTSEIVTEPVL